MKRAQPEAALQKRCVEYLRLLENQGKLMFFHVTNAPRNAVTGARLKQMGMRAGVPDLVILFPGGRCCFLELKSAKGSLTLEQAAFKEGVRAMGFPFAVCKSLEELQGTVKGWANV